MGNQTGTRALLDEAAKKYYFWVTSVVSIVMGLATTGTMAAGLASENMTWGLIGVLWAGIAAYIVVLKFLNSRFSNKSWVKWIMIISLSLLLVLMRLTTENAAETHALGYFILVASVFFFDSKVVVYSFVVAVGLDIAMWNLMPIQMESFIKVPRDIAIRYFCYLWVALISVFLVKSFDKLFSLAGKREEEAMSMATQLESTMGNIRTMSVELFDNTEALKVSCDENNQRFGVIHNQTEALRNISEEQSQSMDKNVEILDQIQEEISQVSDSAMSISSKTTEFLDVIKQGTDVIRQQENSLDTSENTNQQIMKVVRELEENSEKIASIVDTIMGIANQTNLLALNASIEAARAGEHGKGFAVVAEEVRKLADETKMAVNNIDSLVQTNKSSTQQTVYQIGQSTKELMEQRNAMNATHKTFEGIEKEAIQIDTAVQEITACVEELIASSEESSNLVGLVAKLTKDASGFTSDILEQVEGYHTKVFDLEKQVKNFSSLAQSLKDEARG